jgi:hypothetical protein
LFLNADEAARDINPTNVEIAALAAARQVLERRRALIAAGDSLCVETTLATRTLLQSNTTGPRARVSHSPVLLVRVVPVAVPVPRQAESDEGRS